MLDKYYVKKEILKNCYKFQSELEETIKPICSKYQYSNLEVSQLLADFSCELLDRIEIIETDHFDPRLKPFKPLNIPKYPKEKFQNFDTQSTLELLKSNGYKIKDIAADLGVSVAYVTHCFYNRKPDKRVEEWLEEKLGLLI